MPGALVVANAFMLLFSPTGIRLCTKVGKMLRAVSIPLILLLATVGAYAVNNSLTDIYWMLGFGVPGYLMKLYGWPIGPIIPGVIPSGLLDDNLRSAIVTPRESPAGFFEGIVTRPLSLIFFTAVILVFVGQAPLWRKAIARFAAHGPVRR